MFFDVIRGLFEVSANGGDGHRGQDGGDGTAGRDSGRSIRSMHTFSTFKHSIIWSQQYISFDPTCVS